MHRMEKLELFCELCGRQQVWLMDGHYFLLSRINEEWRKASGCQYEVMIFPIDSWGETNYGSEIWCCRLDNEFPPFSQVAEESAKDCYDFIQNLKDDHGVPIQSERDGRALYSDEFQAFNR